MALAMALVDRGADVDARDADQAPLHKACGNGNDGGHGSVDRGADVDAIDVNEMTPLHDARW